MIKLTEENWYFKLKDQQAWLINYIEANPGFIQPDHRRNEVLGFLKNNVLEDLCITRPANRLTWGIPIPFDADYVTYVWFDALVNYISIPAAHGESRNFGNSSREKIPALRLVRAGARFRAKRRNPDQPRRSGAKSEFRISGVARRTCISLARTILQFHAVFWPIMLEDARWACRCRSKILALHGWWQKEGAKLSKSTGNAVVDPLAKN